MDEEIDDIYSGAVETEPEPEPTTEPIVTACGNCQAKFTFDVDKSTQSFTYDCNFCGARSEWSR